jgi:predicted Zn-dependent peptidase
MLKYDPHAFKEAFFVLSIYQKSTLPGGLRVITEEIPHVRSASLGVWVGAGSCWETPADMGISHFIEHMLFKGTERRTARQISQEIDGRGGNLNAFTAKEHTCYYAKVLDQHLPVAVNVLADMVQHSLIDTGEVAKEKGVIIEEIKMYEDVPDDLVHDIFAEAMWAGHALGRPIVGTTETVQSFTPAQLRAYMQATYTPENIVIAAAGNIGHEQVLAEVETAFRQLAQAPHGDRTWQHAPADIERPTAVVREKETEQAHLVLGVKGLHQEHDDIYALHLLNTVLGGGSSSRLFQEIREERGLAYSVYSFHSSFRDTGNFGVYAGVSPTVLPQVLELILKGFRTAGEDGLTPLELAEAKEQLKGQIMLGLESTTGRMSRLGRGELTFGRVLTPDEIISKIDVVTPEQVQQVAHRLLIDEPMVLSVVGPVSESVNLSNFGFPEVSRG